MIENKMSTCIDFHTHILPGVDDGSRSVEESVGLLCMEAEQGIRCVVATPHFYANHDSPERFLKRRKMAWDRLREVIKDRAELPEVVLGAEVYYFPGMSDCDELQKFTVGKSRHMLLEMPCSPWTESMYREIEAIRTKQGITPIIAHIDRYIGPFRTFGIPKRLEDLPVLVQANAEFFLSRVSAGMAMRMLQQDRIHLLGSDCHDLKQRKPNLEMALTAIEKRLDKTAYSRIREYEEAVLKEATM